MPADTQTGPVGRRWRRRPPRVRNRRDDALANLDPYEFERVVAEYYRREGYKVEHCGGSGRFDGGIDLKMHRDSEYVIVQCKRENAYQVTHNVGHELLGVLLTEKADRAIVVNTGEFTPYAIETATREPRLELIDGDRLREMLPEYAQPVPAPEPVDDLDRHVFSVPQEELAPTLEPMVMPRTKAPKLSKAKRSRAAHNDPKGVAAVREVVEAFRLSILDKDKETFIGLFHSDNRPVPAVPDHGSDRTPVSDVRYVIAGRVGLPGCASEGLAPREGEQ